MTGQSTSVSKTSTSVKNKAAKAKAKTSTSVLKKPGKKPPSAFSLFMEDFTKDNKGDNTKVEVGKGKEKVNSTEFAKEKEMTRRSTESRKYSWFPDELVIMILLYLPADILYNVVRYVCRQWYNIIESPTFISSHLEKGKTAPGLFVNKYNLFVNKYPGTISYSLKPISDHGCGFKAMELNSQCATYTRATCNGLVFVVGPQGLNFDLCPCYIANLVTKQQLPLPLIPGPVEDVNMCFAYAAASKVYKVIYPLILPCRSWKKIFLILTVGVDKAWRKVDISELTSKNDGRDFVFDTSFSLGGFMYWIWVPKPPREKCVVCFDVETETFRRICLPPECQKKGGFRLLEMNGFLCLCWMVRNLVWKFWLLKGQESGDGQWQWQWEKLLDIDVEDQTAIIEKLLRCNTINFVKPLGWLRSRGELLLILCICHGIFVYNVNTREFHQPNEVKKMVMTEGNVHAYAHVDSLVPINNLSLVTQGPPPKMFRCRAQIYSKDNMRAEFHAPPPESEEP